MPRKFGYPPQKIISKSGTDRAVNTVEVMATPLPSNLLHNKYVDNNSSTLLVATMNFNIKLATIMFIVPAKRSNIAKKVWKSGGYHEISMSATPLFMIMVLVISKCTAGSFPGRIPSLDIWWIVKRKIAEAAKNMKTNSTTNNLAFDNMYPPKRLGSTNMIQKITYKNLQHSFGNLKNGYVNTIVDNFKVWII